MSDPLRSLIRDRFSTKRKASDGPAGDEGMALATGEEHDGSDGAFVASRKLVEYANTATF